MLKIVRDFNHELVSGLCRFAVYTFVSEIPNLDAAHKEITRYRSLTPAGEIIIDERTRDFACYNLRKFRCSIYLPFSVRLGGIVSCSFARGPLTAARSPRALRAHVGDEIFHAPVGGSRVQ